MLLLALCGSAYAGNMPTDTPTPLAGEIPNMVTGDMPNDVAGNIPCGSPQDAQTAGVIIESALVLLQSALAVF